VAAAVAWGLVKLYPLPKFLAQIPPMALPMALLEALLQAVPMALLQAPAHAQVLFPVLDSS